MTKIIIVDDHQLFREGVKRILDFEDSFEVVAEGTDRYGFNHELGNVERIKETAVEFGVLLRKGERL